MLVHPACNRLPALPHASHEGASVPTAHKLVPGASQVGGDQVCVYLVPEHLMGNFLIPFRPEYHSLQASVSQQTCNSEGLERKKKSVSLVLSSIQLPMPLCLFPFAKGPVHHHLSQAGVSCLMC